MHIQEGKSWYSKDFKERTAIFCCQVAFAWPVVPVNYTLHALVYCTIESSTIKGPLRVDAILGVELPSGAAEEETFVCRDIAK